MTRMTRSYQLLVALMVALLPLLLLGPQPTQAKTLSHDINYWAAGDVACVSPPANFDPMSASTDQLSYYGMPRRPLGGSRAVAYWADMLRHAKQRVCGNPVPGNSYHTFSKSQTNEGNRNNPIWAGYVATDGGFNEVWGDWVVPCYDPSHSPSGSTASQWVGLGAYFGGNLWQGGTETDPPEGYRFWYEDAPQQPTQYYGPAVTCHDRVAVEADYNFTRSNESYIWMANYTKGQYANKTLNYQPDNSSAEWIEERSQCLINKQFIPSQLADYGSTNWSDVQAQSTRFGSGLEPLSYWDYYSQTMVDGTTTLAFTSGVFSDGETFYDSWENAGSYKGCSV